MIVFSFEMVSFAVRKLISFVSQFLGRLIRSPESRKRRKGLGLSKRRWGLEFSKRRKG